jgi:hypothetical protein
LSNRSLANHWLSVIIEALLLINLLRLLHSICGGSLLRFRVQGQLTSQKLGNLTTMNMQPSFASFLREQKERYLAAVADGRGDSYVVVMGNEAGGALCRNHFPTLMFTLELQISTLL